MFLQKILDFNQSSISLRRNQSESKFKTYFYINDLEDDVKNEFKCNDVMLDVVYLSRQQ